MVKRAAWLVGALLVVLGVFWAGRESTHGLSAFWEHWWCPVPLVIVVLGLSLAAGAAFTARRPGPTGNGGGLSAK